MGAGVSQDQPPNVFKRGKGGSVLFALAYTSHVKIDKHQGHLIRVFYGVFVTRILEILSYDWIFAKFTPLS